MSSKPTETYCPHRLFSPNYCKACSGRLHVECGEVWLCPAKCETLGQSNKFCRAHWEQSAHNCSKAGALDYKTSSSQQLQRSIENGGGSVSYGSTFITKQVGYIMPGAPSIELFTGNTATSSTTTVTTTTTYTRYALK
jgi:hypothetical protein